MKDSYWDNYDRGQENAHDESPASGGFHQAMDEMCAALFRIFETNDDCINGLRDGFSDGLNGVDRRGDD